MSDFRSLLNSFQAATGVSNTSANANIQYNKTHETHETNGKDGNQSKPIYDNKKNRETIEQSIQNLWRKSQIQKSFAHQQRSKSKSSQSKDASSSRSTAPATARPIHVAICATIVSTFPHEHIWRSWLQHHDTDANISAAKPTETRNVKTHIDVNSDQDKHNDETNTSTSTPIPTPTPKPTITTTASMHIHAKTPSAASIQNNPWLKSKCLPFTHNPNWNDVRIVQAMLSLIEDALKDDRTTHIMFVTESCIPISTLEELGNMLRGDDTNGGNSDEHINRSYLDFYNRDSTRCTRFDEHACFRIPSIPEEAIYKALPGWCLLSKSHASQILHLPSTALKGRDLYSLFQNVWAPEEVYFATALSLLGLLPGEEVVERSIMWARWDERARGKDRAHPIEYDRDFGRSLVDDARGQKCYFMRKLKKRIDLRVWESIVYHSLDDPVRNRSASASSCNVRKYSSYDDDGVVRHNQYHHHRKRPRDERRRDNDHRSSRRQWRR